MLDSNIFWAVFEPSVNLMQGAFFAYFMCGVLGFRREGKLLHAGLYTLCALLEFGALTFFNYTSTFEGVAIFTYSMLMFVFALIFLVGSVPKKLFMSLVTVNAMSAGSILSTNIVSFIVNKPIMEYITQSSHLRLVTVAFSNLIFFAVLFTVKKIMSGRQMTLSGKEWMFLSADLLLSVCCYMFMYYAIFSSASITANLFIALGVLVILIINVTMYYLLVRLSLRHEIKLENTLLRQQTAFQSAEIKKTMLQYEEVQKVRHDFKNVLCVIQCLNDENKQKEIDEYIGDYLESQQQYARIISTGNSFVDAIVNAKLERARQEGIEVVVFSVTDLICDYSLDFCSLLGNLMDNAIRGCAGCVKKTIRLEIKQDDKSITVCVKNTVPAPVIANNPSLATSKKDEKNHGYGTKIVRETAERHGGFADFYDEGSMFCCNVIMYK